MAELVLTLAREAQLGGGSGCLAAGLASSSDQALQINLVNEAGAGGRQTGTSADGGRVGMLQAGQLLLEHQLLALGAELLDAARQHVIFVHLLVQHQRDFVDLDTRTDNSI